MDLSTDLNAVLSSTGGVTASQLIDSSPVQDPNALIPIFVTPAGIVTLVKCLHSSKVHIPIRVTPLGIVILANL